MYLLVPGPNSGQAGVGAHRQGWLGQRLQDRQRKLSTAHLGEDDWGAKLPELSRWGGHCQGVEEGRCGMGSSLDASLLLGFNRCPSCLPA